MSYIFVKQIQQQLVKKGFSAAEKGLMMSLCRQGCEIILACGVMTADHFPAV